MKEISVKVCMFSLSSFSIRLNNKTLHVRLLKGDRVTLLYQLKTLVLVA